MSCLNIIRHLYFFAQSVINYDEFKTNNKKYTLSKIELLFLGLSISYLLTIIFTGFNLN